MIDVHAHVIPCVDDGSDGMEKSVAMLKEEAALGVTDVICTPHYREGSFTASDEEVLAKFEELKEKCRAEGVAVNLYTGREISYNGGTKAMLKSGGFLSLANTEYVLLEFHYTKKTDIDEACYEVEVLGRKPVVAHVERYVYFRDYDAIAALRRGGALIQVNASSIAGKGGFGEKRFVKGLLKRRLVDVVGSDVHSSRVNYMREAYERVKKKYPDYADRIFTLNAKKILGIT